MHAPLFIHRSGSFRVFVPRGFMPIPFCFVAILPFIREPFFLSGRGLMASDVPFGIPPGVEFVDLSSDSESPEENPYQDYDSLR